METNNQKILETVQNYIDGYLGAQSGLMKKAFHTQTRLFSVDEEDLDTTEMIDWLSNIEERQLKGDIRKGKSEIKFLDITNNTAIVKLVLSLDKFEFTDYLSILNIKNEWIIVNKIYSVKEL